MMCVDSSFVPPVLVDYPRPAFPIGATALFEPFADVLRSRNFAYVFPRRLSSRGARQG